MGIDFKRLPLELRVAFWNGETVSAGKSHNSRESYSSDSEESGGTIRVCAREIAREYGIGSMENDYITRMEGVAKEVSSGKMESAKEGTNERSNVGSKRDLAIHGYEECSMDIEPKNNARKRLDDGGTLETQMIMNTTTNESYDIKGKRIMGETANRDGKQLAE